MKFIKTRRFLSDLYELLGILTFFGCLVFAIPFAFVIYIMKLANNIADTKIHEQLKKWKEIK